MMGLKRALLLGFCGVAASSTACALLTGVGDLSEAPGCPSCGDAMPLDVTGTDARGDAGTPADAAKDGTADGPVTVYSDISNPLNWTSFDLSAIGGLSGFIGGAFDGRYVYFSPNNDGTVLRFDTTGSFGNAVSWSTFDTTTVDNDTGRFKGATFDGRYVYFVPEQYYSYTDDAGSHSGYGGVLARFDTKGLFTDTAAWTTFDMTTIDSSANGYAGATFDGRFLYCSDHENNSGSDSTIARYDTRGLLDSGSSWATYDTTAADPASGATTGAVFDGRYVYFGPDDNSSGVMERYDTAGFFASNTSWTTFNPALFDAGAFGYVGQAFDGRYVYFVPGANSSGPHGLALRYDPQLPFAPITSWELLDMSAIDPLAVGFAGAAFDGRYVYFVPNTNGLLVRYDTLAPFTGKASWRTFAATTVNVDATGFFGAIFDGRYVYLVPNANSVVLRFDAKQPASMPPGYSGSFL
jgi:hypothetical protein